MGYLLLLVHISRIACEINWLKRAILVKSTCIVYSFLYSMLFVFMSVKCLTLHERVSISSYFPVFQFMGKLFVV